MHTPKPASFAPQQQELVDFKHLYSLVRRYKWVLLASLMLFVSATYYLVNYYMLPAYQSKATVLIAETQNRLPSSGNEIGQMISNSFSINPGQNATQSAIYLFQSKELANQIATEMLELKMQPDGKKYPVLWASFPDDSTTASVKQIAQRIRSGMKVQLAEPGSNLLLISFESYSPYESSRIINFAVNRYQDLSVKKKQKSAENAHAFLLEKKEELKSELSTSEQQLGQFTGSQDLVALDSQASNAVNTLSNLEAERQATQIKLESTNTAIDNYKKQMESIKPGLSDQYSRALGPTINNYQQRLGRLRTQKFVLLSNNPELKKDPNSEPEIRQLNQQIEELKQEIQTLSKEMLGENEKYLGFLGDNNGNLTQEISNIQNKLLQLQLEKNQFEAQISAINQRINQSRGFLDRVPQNQIQLSRLQRMVDMNKKLYTTIAQQEAEVGLWQQTQSSNATVFDYATVSKEPVKPQKIIWFLGSILLGLFLPLGVVLVKDHFTSVINSTERLKRTFSYPLLSVVYDYSLLESRGWSYKSNKDIVSGISKDIIMYHDTTSPIAESYRRMVGNLLYGNPDRKPKSLLVTSSGAAEGKTTVTSNLGWAFAEMGEKVLIIDCDFRKPNTNKQFGFSLIPGLSELTYGESEYEKAIRSTKASGLFVLPAGKRPIQPTKLTSSQTFKNLIDKLKAEYDIILFDTPPHGIVSDVTPVFGMCDHIIVAARFNETKELILKNTLEDISTAARHQDIGLVFTMYKPSKSTDTYETRELYKYQYQEYNDYAKLDNKKNRR